jgi:hypothetical protein
VSALQSGRLPVGGRRRRCRPPNLRPQASGAPRHLALLHFPLGPANSLTSQRGKTSTSDSLPGLSGRPGPGDAGSRPPGLGQRRQGGSAASQCHTAQRRPIAGGVRSPAGVARPSPSPGCLHRRAPRPAAGQGGSLRRRTLHESLSTARRSAAATHERRRCRQPNPIPVRQPCRMRGTARAARTSTESTPTNRPRCRFLGHLCPSPSGRGGPRPP